ncbi:MAG TPA: response regulator, partial [Candidatus Limnocylindria bacterium]|nr:response regulator [Candidatus Limnocylindria bacterium]
MIMIPMRSRWRLNVIRPSLRNGSKGRIMNGRRQGTASATICGTQKPCCQKMAWTAASAVSSAYRKRDQPADDCTDLFSRGILCPTNRRGVCFFALPGSMASVLLHASRWALQAVRARDKKGNGAVAPKKILLVDDSEMILQMEQMILQQDRYEVVMARDGHEGVKKALKLKPDLILMDVIMPNLDGFEAVKRLREHPDTRRVPIIMVTSKAEAESMETG